MIRKGTIDDLSEIIIVRTSVNENHLSVEQLNEYGITQDFITAKMSSGELSCWVAVVNCRVVGFAMAERDTAHVFALFVLPEFEGKGFGSGLLNTCENWLKSIGHNEAILTTGPGTRAFEFYRRKGWIETGAVSKLFGEDFELRKVLREL